MVGKLDSLTASPKALVSFTPTLLFCFCEDWRVTNDGLHWIDGIVIAIYASSTLGIGWYYGRQQHNTDEYFVGNRSMNPLLVGISLFATLFSTISYLASPGEYINHGPTTLTSILSIPIVYLVVGCLMIPVYMQHKVTSAYELLETKLGPGVRLLAATLFVLLRLGWMSLLIYMASSAMLEMLNIRPEDEAKWLPVVVLVTGFVSLLYASIGGLRAVVITDLLQFLLLFGGAVLVVATVTVRLGGFDWFPTSWAENWDTQPLFSFDPNVRVTVIGTILTGALWWIGTAGSDQTAIQRFMSTGSAKAARRSFLMNSVAGSMVAIVLGLVGFSLLGYFQSDPSLLPEGRSLAESADRLFPYYISHHLPVGLSGLIVSGLFAAAMSSIDSGVNSISAVVLTDFVDRFRSQTMSERTHILAAKAVAFGIGVTVVLTSSFVMKHVPGNFLEMTQRIANLLICPIFVMFFMALFVPFATSRGTIVGVILGSFAAITVAYWEPLIGYLDVEPRYLKTISFQWIQPVAFVTGLGTALAASLLEQAIQRRLRAD